MEERKSLISDSWKFLMIHQVLTINMKRKEKNNNDNNNNQKFLVTNCQI